MTVDLDEELARLVPDALWRRALPPPPASGHAALDRAVAALERGAIEEAREIVRLEAPPNLVDLVLETAERIELEHRPILWAPERDIPALPEALLSRARLLYKQTYRAHDARRALIQRMVVLIEERIDAGVEEKLLALVERPCPPILREALAGTLLGWRWDPFAGQTRKVDAIAAAPRLRALAAHLRADDALTAQAAQALLVLDPGVARPRLSSFLEGLTAGNRAVALREIARGIGSLVAFDDDPQWVDLLSPVLGSPDHVVIALATLNRLTASRTPAPLLRALRLVTDDTVFATLLSAVQDLADASIAGELEEIAGALPNVRTKAARSRKAVLTVVKRLRDAPSKPKDLGGVGTDGGPIVVLSEKAARVWRGASSPAWAELRGEPMTAFPDDDYGRACAVVTNASSAWMVVGEESVLVLAARACDCVASEERFYLVTDGDAGAVDAIRVARRRAGAKREVLDAAGGALVVLDAAVTLEVADAERAVRLAVPPGRYIADEAASKDGATRAIVLSARNEAGIRR